MTTDLDPVPCQGALPLASGDVRCALPAGHPGHHRAGRHRWSDREADVLRAEECAGEGPFDLPTPHDLRTVATDRTLALAMIRQFFGDLSRVMPEGVRAQMRALPLAEALREIGAAICADHPMSAGLFAPLVAAQERFGFEWGDVAAGWPS